MDDPEYRYEPGFERLRSMTKDQLLELLVPLVLDAICINDAWAGDADGVHPEMPDFDPSSAEIEIWVALRNLHDDYEDLTDSKPSP